MVKGIPEITPIPLLLEVERLVGMSLYMFANFFPFVILPLFGLTISGSLVARYLLFSALIYASVLTVLSFFVFRPVYRAKVGASTVVDQLAWFVGNDPVRQKAKEQNKTRANKTGNADENPSIKNTNNHSQDHILNDDSDYFRENQYLYTERNSSIYVSSKFVWPETLHNCKGGPFIFCAVPHGVAPLGITAYPLWSKLWNNRCCRWTTAPVPRALCYSGNLLLLACFTLNELWEGVFHSETPTVAGVHSETCPE